MGSAPRTLAQGTPLPHNPTTGVTCGTYPASVQPIQETFYCWHHHHYCRTIYICWANQLLRRIVAVYKIPWKCIMKILNRGGGALVPLWPRPRAATHGPSCSEHSMPVARPRTYAGISTPPLPHPLDAVSSRRSANRRCQWGAASIGVSFPLVAAEHGTAFLPMECPSH